MQSEVSYQEWYELLMEAKRAGLTVEQVREFFEQLERKKEVNK
ncbi:hypothetical protein CWO92_22200 [Heyndrickxia camelliae]|uniref:Sin domain-containing protein n=1 Tax=Heyndrickxia camelliae TaxID=1707093 RepID=A0A2N3LE67_9BACI|nr:hypothetical protein CWO92_22200 [Heyndrickxia camelliae]